MPTQNTNGQSVRKTLSSQLDRLDGIIDTLADGLNQAVVDAVRDAVTLAVQQAVEVVLRELLTRPEILQTLAGQVSPVTAAPAEPKPSKLKRLLGCVGAKISKAGAWIALKLRALPGMIGAKTRSVGTALIGKLGACCRGIRGIARKAWELRKPVSLSLLIGLLVGSIGYLAGPFLASLALGVGSSAMSLLGFLAAPYVRLWQSLRMHGN